MGLLTQLSTSDKIPARVIDHQFWTKHEHENMYCKIFKMSYSSGGDGLPVFIHLTLLQLDIIQQPLLMTNEGNVIQQEAQPKFEFYSKPYLICKPLHH